VAGNICQATSHNRANTTECPKTFASQEDSLLPTLTTLSWSTARKSTGNGVTSPHAYDTDRGI
jgi:hypothetical protein